MNVKAFLLSCDELVIIDEISIVSSKLFYQVHKYLVLRKIFHLVENLFWFEETCVIYHQFVQNLHI